ncbi:septation protein SepH [Mycolicibacterium litorale]|uniref:septation protein SepH n=1 Tax=Mycolicibacterium litorale TaxID=758802 RepID=UPI001628752F|nr:septation protein SepH [Mycolicibacterium litorale]
MRQLRVVELDVDGKTLVCQTDSGEKYTLRVDERLRAAARGDRAGFNRAADQTMIDVEVHNVLRPRDIQSKIRAGASVEQVANASGMPIERVERFAHPVLLERSRAAELATAAHPVLSDGPAVLTLLETVSTALVARGLDPDATTWDAWRNEDGRWTVQVAWKAGRSDNVAHFRFAPGAHGGTVTAFDEAAYQLIDPNFARPLRPVAPLAQLDFDTPSLSPAAAPAPAPQSEPEPAPEPEAEAPKPAKSRKAKARPTVPGWEDVLLGVRSSGQR